MKDNSFLALPIPVRMSKLFISMHFYANRLHGLAWFCISLFIISAFVHVISCVTWVTQESTEERRRIWALSYSDAYSMCANLCIFGHFKHAGLCSWIALDILFTIHLCVVKFRQVDGNHFTENNVGLFFSATHNSSSYICECNNMCLILVHVRYRSAVGRWSLFELLHISAVQVCLLHAFIFAISVFKCFWNVFILQ